MHVLCGAQSCPTPCDPMDCVACQVPLSMGSFRQEYWCELSCPPSGDLPNPEIEPRSPTLQTDSLPAEPQGKPSVFSNNNLKDNDCVFAGSETQPNCDLLIWPCFCVP